MKTMHLRSISGIFLLAIALFAPSTYGAGEVEYIVQKEFDTLAPVYMAGHDGDSAWIQGFVFSGSILLQGQVVGSVSGEVRLSNPPLNVFRDYTHVSVTSTNSINGLGTFEVHAEGVALASSTTAAAGDVLVSYAGSIANGTGFFRNGYGLASAAIVSNFYVGTASGSEIVRLRSGF
jgi:hypothetical protein